MNIQLHTIDVSSGIKQMYEPSLMLNLILPIKPNTKRKTANNQATEFNLIQSNISESF